MELTAGNKKVFSALVSFMVGCFFLVSATMLSGFGAAIAVSQEILQPLHKISPLLALSVSELVLLGIPIAALFCAIYWLFKRCKVEVQPVLLVIPFVSYYLYSITWFFFNLSNSHNYIVIVLVKLLPVLICVYVLAKREKSQSKMC